MPSEDSMRSRVPGSRVKLWLLVGANRLLVAALVLVVVFVALAALVAVDPAPLERAISTADPVETLFQAMLTSIVTAVTLVVTINQVVLSQELGAAGDQRERMQGALSFRDDVADHLADPVAPAEPATFLQGMLDATAERVRDLREASVDCPDPDCRDAIERYANELAENAETVRDDLADAQFGSFDVVQAALGFNYSLKIHEGKRLQALYGSGAPDEERVLNAEARDALTEAVTLLEQFGPAREHVKTMYFQWALVDLSRVMLYAAVPALVLSIAGILTLGNAGTVGGSTLGVANHSWVVLLTVTLALAPFALLLAYVLRIGTVAKRTLAIGPFVLRDTGEDDDRS